MTIDREIMKIERTFQRVSSVDSSERCFAVSLAPCNDALIYTQAATAQATVTSLYVTSYVAMDTADDADAVNVA